MPSIELFGHARILAGKRSIQTDATNIRDALSELANGHPRLVGPVLNGDGSPTPAYVLNLNGTRFTGDLSEALAEDDTLLLFSSLSGG